MKGLLTFSNSRTAAVMVGCPSDRDYPAVQKARRDLSFSTRVFSNIALFMYTYFQLTLINTRETFNNCMMPFKLFLH